MSARWLLALFAILSLALPVRADTPPAGLDIYFIDTEGGAATLIVTPQARVDPYRLRQPWCPRC